MACQATLRKSMIASLIFLTAGRAPAVAGDWHQELATTRPEFSQVPFWFWNDRLDENEIKRQMADFRDHGVYGFIIHARMGLPRTSPTWANDGFTWFARAVEEAARTDMRVCLYDEGMYPSGSAHGAVVRSNPAFAARGLMMTSQDVTGPTDLPRPPSRTATSLPPCSPSRHPIRTARRSNRAACSS